VPRELTILSGFGRHLCPSGDLNNEPERDRLLDVLANDDRVMVSAVTLYETMLVAAMRRGPDNLSDLAQLLETVEAEIVPFDANQGSRRLGRLLRYGNGNNPTARPNPCDCVAYHRSAGLEVHAVGDKRQRLVKGDPLIKAEPLTSVPMV
jgi:uncharacterized protein with PIN domain